jgi:hypothetical protein
LPDYVPIGPAEEQKQQTVNNCDNNRTTESTESTARNRNVTRKQDTLPAAALMIGVELPVGSQWISIGVDWS